MFRRCRQLCQPVLATLKDTCLFLFNRDYRYQGAGYRYAFIGSEPYWGGAAGYNQWGRRWRDWNDRFSRVHVADGSEDEGMLFLFLEGSWAYAPMEFMRLWTWQDPGSEDELIEAFKVVSIRNAKGICNYYEKLWTMWSCSMQFDQSGNGFISAAEVQGIPCIRL